MIIWTHKSREKIIKRETNQRRRKTSGSTEGPLKRKEEKLLEQLMNSNCEVGSERTQRIVKRQRL